MDILYNGVWIELRRDVALPGADHEDESKALVANTDAKHVEGEVLFVVEEAGSTDSAGVLPQDAGGVEDGAEDEGSGDGSQQT